MAHCQYLVGGVLDRGVAIGFSEDSAIIGDDTRRAREKLE